MWEALQCWIAWLARTLYSYMVDAAEFVLEAIVIAINAMLSILPQDPREQTGAIDSAVIDAFNYVIPFRAILVEFSVLMTAWIIYRIYQWALSYARADF